LGDQKGVSAEKREGFKNEKGGETGLDRRGARKKSQGFGEIKK